MHLRDLRPWDVSPAAVAVVLACYRHKHFMPEPTRLAHQLVTAYARDHRRGL